MPLPANLAVNPDEFMDYYELLDLPQDATTAELRARINDLYAEAQANRDHRNPAKRREYQLWLDLLPQARALMTDETKRAKYDEYRRRYLDNALVPPYAEFLRGLEDKPAKADEAGSVLGLREQAAKTPPVAPPRRATAPAASGSSGGSATGAIAALVALVIVAGIAYAATHKIDIALIAGAVVAGIVYVVMRGGKKVAR